MTITLREDQERAVSEIRAALRDHASVMFRGPTGMGKTVLASYIAQQAIARGNKVVFCVHRIELATQTAKTFDRFGIKYGFIASGRPYNPFALAQIASADTLRNRPELLKGTALLVPDEAHLFASKTRAALIQTALDCGAKIVGLSATPERLDGKPLDMFDTLVEGPSEAWLIEQGHLSEYRAFAPVRPDLSGIGTRGGDYIVGEVEERLDKPAIYGDAIDAWLKYAAGKRTMVFAISRAHGQHVTDAYNAAGIPAVYIDGTTPDHERRRRIVAFADGDAKILVSINLAIEGFDLSAQVDRDVPVEAVQLLNPTKSLPRARQMMGRALRKKPYPAIILDHVNMILNADGTVNHGFPDDVREWSLEGRKGMQEGVPSFDVKLCESCFASYRAALTACPYCSSERTVKPRKVEEIEGELAEIQRAEAENDLKKLKRIEVGRAKDLDALADIALSRKYKAGWLIKQAAAKHIHARLPWKDACAAMMGAQSRARNKVLTV